MSRPRVQVRFERRVWTERDAFGLHVVQGLNTGVAALKDFYAGGRHWPLDPDLTWDPALGREQATDLMAALQYTPRMSGLIDRQVLCVPPDSLLWSALTLAGAQPSADPRVAFPEPGVIALLDTRTLSDTSFGGLNHWGQGRGLLQVDGPSAYLPTARVQWPAADPLMALMQRAGLSRLTLDLPAARAALSGSVVLRRLASYDLEGHHNMFVTAVPELEHVRPRPANTSPFEPAEAVVIHRIQAVVQAMTGSRRRADAAARMMRASRQALLGRAETAVLMTLAHLATTRPDLVH